MCGVVAGLGEPSDEALLALTHRGPDHQALVRCHGVWLGHTRLAILDVGGASNQPFPRGSVTLSYNGELWNHAALRAELRQLGHAFKTSGDTEVFAAAVQQWGHGALAKMQGMFGAVWTLGDGVLHVARDRHGEVPLHAFMGRQFTVASELKALCAMQLDPRGFEWVGPGEVWEVSSCGIRRKHWYLVPEATSCAPREQARRLIFDGVQRGSLERTVADVPMCTLLSGGVDSAVVAAHLATQLPNLVAYVAVMASRSRDLRAARVVAEHLGLELREVNVPAPSCDDLARVVHHIEQPHKAQVEIGWACLKLAECMRADGFKVTFSGEGSDELWASYGFAYHGVAQKGWSAYRRELFRDQHRKNFARCNKVFMAHGVECRLPFLSTQLVEDALSLPQAVVQDGKSRPKAVLQDAHAAMLPSSILCRPKLAFQDGMGLKSRCEEAVSDPRRFYRAVFAQAYES